MPADIHEVATIPPELALERLDIAAVRLFPQYSRARLQQWIKSGELTVDGELRRPKDKVSGGEEIEIDATVEEISFEPEPVPLDVVYEDEALLVINKAAGLVVHPGAGNTRGTLLNGLIYYDPGLSGVPRAGIVHRLDKNTTGLLVVAKSLASQNSLVQQLQAREVSRIYEAVVHGVMTVPGKVSAPIGRHPVQRTRMAVLPAGKEAVTHYRVLRSFPRHTHIEVSLETGRTHQIRVHMQDLGFPLVGDPTYGKRGRERNEALAAAIRHLGRQALHARRLSLVHPVSGRQMSFESSLPQDMLTLLSELEAES